MVRKKRKLPPRTPSNSRPGSVIDKKDFSKPKRSPTPRRRTGKVKRRFWRDNYSESWNYIMESRNFIYSAIGIFLFFAVVGFMFTPPPEIVEQILKFIQEIIEKTEGMGAAELSSFIFLNNVQSSFFALLFGVVLGIFPVFAAAANGYVVGFVSQLAVQGAGISSLWRLFPHGIFELPAIFISLGLGLKFGSFIFNKRDKKKAFIRYLANGLRVFFFVVVPLLIIAAIVEGMLIFYFG